MIGIIENAGVEVTLGPQSMDDLKAEVDVALEREWVDQRPPC